MQRSVICLVTILLSASSALADPAAVAKAQSEAYAKAFGTCDVPAVVALYEDNAILINPGEGEVGTGKAEIEKVIRAGCSSGPANSVSKAVSSDARAIGKDYVVNVGMSDETVQGPDGKPMVVRVRTTELLHKSDGKWRYVIDHASIGQPPSPAAKP
jgi:uncharacterized protein (TIGR02246 family)